MWTTQKDKLQGTQSEGDPHNIMRFISRKPIRFQWQTLEKNPLGQGKRNHAEIHQSTAFLTRPPFRRNGLNRA